ncbi:hypothetical protein [Mucilaginibacter sp.]|uniref:hypothetical protein n=1 Tax=Mucilaginibacter sp. TaxID=1882438 RepID=UPI0035BC49C5
MNFNKIASFCLLSCLMLMCCINKASAQDKYNTEVPKDIIILRSTKDYKSALATAKQAATRLHKKLDLRGLTPDKKIGLTMSKADCFGSGGGDDLGYPCYQARGDGNAFNDNYISVEYSDAYKGFAKGYYIVVAAITDVKSTDMKAQLAGINKL